MLLKTLNCHSRRGCPSGYEGGNPGNKIPKTGLAEVMRDWMKSRTGTKAQRRFTVAQICEALTVDTAKQHQAVANALADFIKRKEVGIVPRTIRQAARLANAPNNSKYNRRQYLYVLDWHKELKGKINRKLYLAMYVSQQFTVADIKRLTGLADRNWIDKIVRSLMKEGHLQQISRRPCAHGAGAEKVYHITDRDKFKLMKLLRASIAMLEAQAELSQERSDAGWR